MKDLLQDGLQGILLHRMRSLLSAVGILFGVGSVIGILSIGEGARLEQEQLIAQLGILNFQIQVDYPEDDDLKEEIWRVSQGLSSRDVQAIRVTLPDIAGVGGMKDVRVREIIPRPRQPLQVIGAEPAWLGTTALRLLQGRPLSLMDEARHAAVCWIGLGAEQSLFGGARALHQWIRLEDVWVRVVGVFEDPTTRNATTMDGVDIDDRSMTIVLPLSTSLKRFEPVEMEPELSEIQVSVRHIDQVVGHVQLTRALLSRLHREQDDYSLVIPLKLLEQSREQQRIFNLVMGLIAGISLLVGGIGIMNIMLASVMERTREIGIRLAVGATPRDIWLLFLTEAVLISLVGGLLGVLAGFGISASVAAATGWATAVSPAAVILATAISTLEGVVFGFIPARQASRLPPALTIRAV